MKSSPFLSNIFSNKTLECVKFKFSLLGLHMFHQDTHEFGVDKNHNFEATIFRLWNQQSAKFNDFKIKSQYFSSYWLSDQETGLTCFQNGNAGLLGPLAIGQLKTKRKIKFINQFLVSDVEENVVQNSNRRFEYWEQFRVNGGQGNLRWVSSLPDFNGKRVHTSNRTHLRRGIHKASYELLIIMLLKLLEVKCFVRQQD